MDWLPLTEYFSKSNFFFATLSIKKRQKNVKQKHAAKNILINPCFAKMPLLDDNNNDNNNNSILIPPQKECKISVKRPVAFTISWKFLVIGIPVFAAIIFFMQLIFAVLQSMGINSFGESNIHKNSIIFCEPIQSDQLIKQPTNAWSAATFYLMALTVIFIVPCNQDFLLLGVQYRNFRILVIFILVYLGIGSFGFHSAFTLASEVLDRSSIQIATSIMFAFTVSRWLRLHTFYLIMLGFVAFGTFIDVMEYLFWKTNFITLIIPSTILGFFISEYCRQYKFRRNLTILSGQIEKIRWLNVALVQLLVGYVCWILDVYFNICFPFEGLFQMHALFHACTAMAIANLFLYMSGM